MNLKELADTLGLSQTTVSRAMNGYPEVAEATRQRVLEAARRHGYRPNTRAKALATGRAMAIGHVIPMSDKNEMVNPIFADFIAGASETYTRNGYDIVLSVAGDDEEGQIYRDMAAKHIVDGVILHSPKVNDPRIALLHDVGLPFVVHGRASEINAAYSWVDVNNLRAFRRATEFLADLGHRRIALVNGRETMDFAVRRRAGYLAGLAARGIPEDPALMLSDDMTEAYGYRAMRSLLGISRPPTAFLAASPITACGMGRAAVEAGRRLGRDVSVITYDDDLAYFRNGGDELIFSALRCSVRDMGRRAAEMLVDLIAGQAPQAQDLLEAELVIGGSTGPARPLPAPEGS